MQGYGYGVPPPGQYVRENIFDRFDAFETRQTRRAMLVGRSF